MYTVEIAVQLKIIYPESPIIKCTALRCLTMTEETPEEAIYRFIKYLSIISTLIFTLITNKKWGWTRKNSWFSNTPKRLFWALKLRHGRINPERVSASGHPCYGTDCFPSDEFCVHPPPFQPLLWNNYIYAFQLMVQSSRLSFVWWYNCPDCQMFGPCYEYYLVMWNNKYSAKCKLISVLSKLMKTQIVNLRGK